MIALLTDFGTKDGYVAAVKGSILSIAPHCPILDITHEIEPQNIYQAAYVLLSSYQYFPKGTIVVCVVDPGVGSNRRILLVQEGDYYFIAPDNGLLSHVLKNHGCSIHEITETKYFRSEVSNTFHGRDIFAPVAANFFLNPVPDLFGKRTNNYVKFDTKNVIIKKNILRSTVLHVDRFGNIILDTLHSHSLFSVGKKDIEVKVILHPGDEEIGMPIRKTFSQVDRGEWVAYFGSAGFLELAVNQGNAAEKARCRAGDTLIIKINDEIP